MIGEDGKIKINLLKEQKGNAINVINYNSKEKSVGSLFGQAEFEILMGHNEEL